MFPNLSLKLPLQTGHSRSQELNSQLLAPSVLANIRTSGDIVLLSFMQLEETYILEAGA